MVSMKGIENPLSHWSPHPVRWHGMKFPNSEAAIQASPFMKHSREVVRLIRTASTPQKAMEIARKNAKRFSRGWRIDEGTVLEITWLKIEQHPNVRSTLMSTGDLPIILDIEDEYWGSGGMGKGLNLAGRIMERCRDELQRNRYTLSQEEIIFNESD